MEIINAICHHPLYPFLILFLIAVALAVVLPWLKRQAEKTETVVDDSIITLLQVWLTGLGKKLMGVKNLFLLVICVFVLSGWMDK